MQTAPFVDPQTQVFTGGNPDELRRQLAIKRIKAKNDFKVHLVVYLAVNTLFVLLWAFTSAWRPYPESFFWPIFPIAGWGIGVVINGYTAYFGNQYTEEQIQREMKRIAR